MTAASHVTPPQQIGIGKRRLRAKTSVKYQQTVQTEELWFVFFFWTEAGFKVYEVRQMWRNQKCDLALRKSVKWGADWCNVIKCCLNKTDLTCLTVIVPTAVLITVTAVVKLKSYFIASVVHLMLWSFITETHMLHPPHRQKVTQQLLQVIWPSASSLDPLHHR